MPTIEAAVGFPLPNVQCVTRMALAGGKDPVLYVEVLAPASDVSNIYHSLAGTFRQRDHDYVVAGDPGVRWFQMAQPEIAHVMVDDDGRHVAIGHPHGGIARILVRSHGGRHKLPAGILGLF